MKPEKAATFPYGSYSKCAQVLNAKYGRSVGLITWVTFPFPSYRYHQSVVNVGVDTVWLASRPPIPPEPWIPDTDASPASPLKSSPHVNWYRVFPLPRRTSTTFHPSYTNR